MVQALMMTWNRSCSHILSTVWQDLSSITGQTIKRFLSFVRSLHQRHAKGLSSLWNGMAMLGKKTSEREQKTPANLVLWSKKQAILDQWDRKISCSSRLSVPYRQVSKKQKSKITTHLSLGLQDNQSLVQIFCPLIVAFMILSTAYWV